MMKNLEKYPSKCRHRSTRNDMRVGSCVSGLYAGGLIPRKPHSTGS